MLIRLSGKERERKGRQREKERDRKYRREKKEGNKQRKEGRGDAMMFIRGIVTF